MRAVMWAVRATVQEGEGLLQPHGWNHDLVVGSRVGQRDAWAVGWHTHKQVTSMTSLTNPDLNVLDIHSYLWLP